MFDGNSNHRTGSSNLATSIEKAVATTYYCMKRNIALEIGPMTKKINKTQDTKLNVLLFQTKSLTLTGGVRKWRHRKINIYDPFTDFFFCPILLLPVPFQSCLVILAAEEPSINVLACSNQLLCLHRRLSSWACYCNRLLELHSRVYDASLIIGPICSGYVSLSYSVVLPLQPSEIEVAWVSLVHVCWISVNPFCELIN